MAELWPGSGEPPDRRGAVIVRSNSRRAVTEVEVYRPRVMPGTVVLFCSHRASDAEIVDACVGKLDDGEMGLLFKHLGITMAPPDPEEQP